MQWNGSKTRPDATRLSLSLYLSLQVHVYIYVLTYAFLYIYIYLCKIVKEYIHSEVCDQCVHPRLPSPIKDYVDMVEAFQNSPSESGWTRSCR